MTNELWDWKLFVGGEKYTESGAQKVESVHVRQKKDRTDRWVKTLK